MKAKEKNASNDIIINDLYNLLYLKSSFKNGYIEYNIITKMLMNRNMSFFIGHCVQSYGSRVHP